MFDVLTTVARIGAAIGLSTGGLIFCAALAWFVASARPLAIAGALIIAAGLGGFLYGDHSGSAAIKAEWADANAKAAEQAKTRDVNAAKGIAATYDPVIVARDKQIATLQTQVQQYEKMLLAAKAGACPLGADALRLRQR